MFTTLVGLNIIFGALLTYIVFRVEEIRDAIPFHVAGLAIGAFLSWVMFRNASLHTDVFFIITAMVLYGPFLAYVVVHYAGVVMRELLSEYSVRMPKFYDRAEKAERLHDLKTALQLYREIHEKDPEDPEPLRRLAEIHLKSNEVEEAISCLEEALEVEEIPHRKAGILFRLADIHAKKKRDFDKAKLTLERNISEFPESREARNAEERLKEMKALEGNV